MSIISKGKNQKKTGGLSQLMRTHALLAPALLGILFFVVTCLGASDTIRGMTMVAAIAALLVTAARFKLLRARIALPFLALTLYVIMEGVSTFYALSGKFALREFLKVFLAYCLAWIMLATAPKEEETGGKRIATILAVCAALGSILSIDLISTRILSGIATGFLGLFGETYQNLAGVEPGVRMISIFINPNTFAGFAGIGVLLSLGLADDAKTRKERCFYLVLLYWTALGFLLAFSMGASAFLAIAFLVFLALERSEKRGGLFLLMLETLVLVALSVALIAMTSLDAWSGIQPVPLLCALAGAALLCVVDCFAVSRLSERIRAHGKTVWVFILVVLVLIGAYVGAAWNLTGSATLAPGESLRRAAYPAHGDYTLDLSAEGDVFLTAESQNRQDTMMHTSTTIYSGPAEDARFTVPEDSMVVYFNFSAPNGATVYSAAVGTSTIPLHYKLFPGFIANRLQGLRANQNAIQRLVFFEDGMKIFRRGPVFGVGMGSFENAIKGVQSFYYETKYTHNHYIQALLEVGVVGLILFLLLLLTSAFAVWKARKKHPYAPALGAALVFMAGHAAVEVIFSTYFYLIVAFGVFTLIDLCCGDAPERPKLSRTLQSVCIGVIVACTVVYSVFLAGNMIAKRKLEKSPTLETLQQCVNLDRFEWADYALPYVTSVTNNEVDYRTQLQADAYAERLSKVNSNTIPIYLAEYYFSTGRTEQAIDMLEKYVDYVSSDESAWQSAFQVMMIYQEDTDIFRGGVQRLAEKLEQWNAENMGNIRLNDMLYAFIEANS